MFQKESLIKRYVFLLYDLVILIASMFLATYIRFGRNSAILGTKHHAGDDNLYLYVLLLSMVATIFMHMVFSLTKHIFDRGLYSEFVAVIKLVFGQFVAVLAYLFMSQQGINYSRIQLTIFFIADAVFTYSGHILLKKIITKYYQNSYGTRQIMLISSQDKIESIMDKFEKSNNWYFNLAYIVLVDVDRTGEEIRGIPVISNKDKMLDAAKTITLDAVFINVSYNVRADFDIQKTLHDFQEMGVIVHVNIDALELDVTDKVIENLGFFKVVSYSSRLLDPASLIIKKCMDKVGAIIGCIITIIIGIFLVPAICMESKGSPIFTQVRVGKNGRRFELYKFRSMYADAELRKKELMNKNQMDGAIFKIDDDPRITKVGKFIRKHSLDELPQFFNVLKGDMSLVGTRPPTVDEVEQYKIEQKRRLSVTPGMTGLWQVSGRSEIYSFDQIVKLDLEYIDRWSIGLDIKLLFKTILVCFTGKGAS